MKLNYDAETDRYCLDGEPLHCGACLEVYAHNSMSHTNEWISTRLEMNAAGAWYLVGLENQKIDGMLARFKG